MATKTSHFKVDNGDMTLIEFESGRRLLVDCKIRCAADDPDDDTPDVGTQLRSRLPTDADGRLYVDAFLLTHPDLDHCCGLERHFHIGPVGDWKTEDDKIVIREMWSSPIVFRRADKKNGPALLCDDARAWAREARRRVKLFRTDGYLLDGDRIVIMGEDVDGKTDDLGPILVRAGQTFSRICGQPDYSFSAFLLAPMLADDDEDEELLTKNNSSVIMQLTLAAEGELSAAQYLFGGDAEVAIWERIWARYLPTAVQYDVLLAPHHCSWHSLSWDSWSDLREKAKVSADARKALSQARPGAYIISSSYSIEDDDDDPPCIRAEREYMDILKPGAGAFHCLADDTGTEPVEISVSRYGPKFDRKRLAASVALGTGIGSEALAHGGSET